MSEPMTSGEIEDVLSSIRRLVSQDKRPAAAPPAVPPPAPSASLSPVPSPVVAPVAADRLLLTPALRVVPPAPQGAVAPAVGLGERVAALGAAVDAQGGAGGPDATLAEDEALLAGDPLAEARFWAEADDWIDDESLTTASWEAEGAVVAFPKAESPAVGEAAAILPEAAPAEAAAVPFGSASDDAGGSDGAEALKDESAAVEGEIIPSAELPIVPALEVGGDGEVDAAVDDALPAGWAQQDPDEAEPGPAEGEGAQGEGAETPFFVSARWADEAAEAALADLVVARLGGAGPVPDALEQAGTADDDGRDTLSYDEELMRDLVRDMIREELQGPLGERITRNIRKLVRAEIARALAVRDLD